MGGVLLDVPDESNVCANEVADISMDTIMANMWTEAFISFLRSYLEYALDD